MPGIPMPMRAMRAAITIMDDASLARLLTWLSPAYPVGGFSYSHGLEWAVEAGDITSRADLEGWIGAVLALGSARNDAILLVHAHRAILAGDDAALGAVAELAAASAGSSERHLETTAQGAAFLSVTRAASPCAALDRLARLCAGPVAYPVAVGVAAAGHGIDEGPALIAYLQGFVAGLVSAAVRLVPLGQTDGQHAQASLMPSVLAAAGAARRASLDELGGSALRSDLAAMHHESQETRLFRS